MYYKNIYLCTLKIINISKTQDTQKKDIEIVSENNEFCTQCVQN